MLKALVPMPSVSTKLTVLNLTVVAAIWADGDGSGADGLLVPVGFVDEGLGFADWELVGFVNGELVWDGFVDGEVG